MASIKKMLDKFDLGTPVAAKMYEDEVPEAKKRVERPQSMRKKPRVKTNMIT